LWLQKIGKIAVFCCIQAVSYRAQRSMTTAGHRVFARPEKVFHDLTASRPCKSTFEKRICMVCAVLADESDNRIDRHKLQRQEIRINKTGALNGRARARGLNQRLPARAKMTQGPPKPAAGLQPGKASPADPENSGPHRRYHAGHYDGRFAGTIIQAVGGNKNNCGVLCLAGVYC